MSSSDGESIFLTQSKFKDDNENHPNTDGVLSDILDMEAGPDFDLIQNCVFSDISDEDMINASQEVESIDRFLKPLNQQDLDDLIRSGLSKKTESKSKWALNLFVDNRWNLDLNTIFLIPQKYKTAFGLFSTRV